MTHEKELFLQSIKSDFCDRADFKFKKGDKEHKGDLFDTDLVTEAKEELIDAFVYISALEKRLQEEYARGFKAALLESTETKTASTVPTDIREVIAMNDGIQKQIDQGNKED